MFGGSSKFESYFNFSDYENSDDKTGIRTMAFFKSADVKAHKLRKFTRTRPDFGGVCTFEWYNEIIEGRHMLGTAQPNNFKVAVMSDTTPYQVLSKYMDPESSLDEKQFALRHALDTVLGDEYFVTVGPTSPYPLASLRQRNPDTANAFQEVLIQEHNVSLFEPKTLMNESSVLEWRYDKVAELGSLLDTDIMLIIKPSANSKQKRSKPNKSYGFRPGDTSVKVVSIKFKEYNIKSEDKAKIIEDIALHTLVSWRYESVGYALIDRIV